MSDIFEYHASDVLKFNLGDFEGPIELLYTLIVKEGKFDILTFPLSKITSQYMQYMHNVAKLDIDIASDFVSVATTLLEIKSKDVLPKIEEFDCDEEEIDYGDEEEELRRRIIIYGLFKEKADVLKLREARNRFHRKPVYSDDDAIIVIKRFNFDTLIDTYGQLLMRLNEQERDMATKKIQKDKHTVEEKITYITTRILSQKKMKFNELFGAVSNKMEVITTFQALLELMKKQVVKTMQESDYSDINIELNDEFDVENIDLEELTKIEGVENEKLV
ncbi:MAG: segregation/condensation protein A [Clostridia bacterium]